MTKQSRPIAVQAGDQFAGQLEDGRYAVVWVLASIKDGQGPGRDSILLGATEYIGDKLPQPDDPRLGRVLSRNRFQWGGQPAASIVVEDLPPTLIRIGNRTPSEEQAVLGRGSYGPSWDRMLQEALMEWRWAHDREAFVHEIEVEKALAANRAAKERRRQADTPRKPTPGARLTERDFWSLLDLISWDAESDSDMVAPVIEALERRSVEDILEFDEILAEMLYRLDSRKLAEQAGVSDDGFLYARCFVVANRRDYYLDVLSNREEFPGDDELESLLYVALHAYEKKTGRNYDHSTHYSFETGSNTAGWTDDR